MVSRSYCRLKTLAEYIERDSVFYAASFVREIIDASSSLNEFSSRGRVVPEIGVSKIREILVRDYRLIYSIEESHITVLGLIHGKRDLKRLLGEEKREI